MKYYKTTEGQLIQYNPETKVYKVRNNMKELIPESLLKILKS